MVAAGWILSDICKNRNNLPWEEVLGRVEDFIAGFAGLVSAAESRNSKKQKLVENHTHAEQFF